MPPPLNRLRRPVSAKAVLGRRSSSPQIPELLLVHSRLFGGSGNEGTVFELDKDGTETVLHSFIDGPDAQPAATAVVDRMETYMAQRK
jgi:uncharacterized repeat protein (TIGR03803 family)